MREAQRSFIRVANRFFLFCIEFDKLDELAKFNLTESHLMALLLLKYRPYLDIFRFTRRLGVHSQSKIIREFVVSAYENNRQLKLSII